MEDQHQGRRRYPRYQIRLKAVAIIKELQSSTPFIFFTENISIGGLFIRGERDSYPFKQNAVLEVAFYLQEDSEDSKIFFKARLVHKTGSNGFGLEIIEIKQEDLERISGFIEGYLAANPDSLVK